MYNYRKNETILIAILKTIWTFKIMNTLYFFYIACEVTPQNASIVNK